MHPEVNPAKTHHKSFVVSYINTHDVESSLVSQSISLQMVERQTCLHISPNFHLTAVSQFFYQSLKSCQCAFPHGLNLKNNHGS